MVEEQSYKVKIEAVTIVEVGECEGGWRCDDGCSGWRCDNIIDIDTIANMRQYVF